jgi:hypothetical protein
MATLTVTGVDVVLSNLNRHRARYAQGIEDALRVAGLLLQRQSQDKVPVDFGPLKASAFTRITGSGFTTVAVVGYTAAYALYVHELIGMRLKGLPRRPPSKGLYWDPQGRAQAKFLEAPFRAFGPDLRRIVLNRLRIT